MDHHPDVPHHRRAEGHSVEDIEEPAAIEVGFEQAAQCLEKKEDRPLFFYLREGYIYAEIRVSVFH